MSPTKPPVKNATYRAKNVPGKPKKTPIRNANLTSPKPIPRPFVSKYKAKKNTKAPRPENK